MKELYMSEIYGKCEKMMPGIFGAISSAVGTHVMLLVLERSLWKTKISYPEADRISFSEDGINLDGLTGLDAAKIDQLLNEFVLSIIETLSRLVGIQIAQKLTEGLTNASSGGEE
jgi:hypothetical protein